MWSHLENVACAVEKNVNSAVLGLNALCISITYIWYNVLSKASVSLLILIWMIYPFDINGVIKVPYNYCITTINFFLLCLLIFALHIKVILCWAHKYLWILYSLLGLTPLSLCIALLCLFFFYSLYFKVYFVWYEWCYQLPFHVHFHGKIFLSLHFQCECVFIAEGSLL